MNMNDSMSSLNAQQKRSIMSFIVIAFFAVGATIFLIGKGSEATSEIELLNNGQLAAKELDEKEGLGTSSISNIAPSEIKGWKTYRNAKYGFEVKYPSNWFVDERAPDMNKEDIAILRTTSYREEKISTEPDKGENSVKVYDGEITISLYPDNFITQQCAYSKETIKLSSGSWRACLSRPEGFSIPALSISSLTPHHSLMFSGVLETERNSVDVNRVSDYHFMILEVVRTFHFIK